MPYSAASNRYESVSIARSGRSGLQLPRISLGLWNNFGDDRPLETQRAILLRAFDLGVFHFDLANNYGPPAGSAESNFGRIVHEDLRPYRDEIVISTKAGYDMWPGPYGEWGSRKTMRASLDQSLKRLQLDYVDVYYSHRPDPNTPIEETMAALASAVHQGKALYVGISNYYTVAETEAAVMALKAEGVPLSIHQPRYNLFDRDIETGLLAALEDLGVGIIAFSPLAQGLLTDRYLQGIPTGSRAAKGRWVTESDITESYLKRARALKEIATSRNQSLAQLAISWVLRHDAVTSALVGASSVHQLEDTLRALDAPPLSPADLEVIEAQMTADPE
ncbi:aldo/keto reductase (plasmid) [Frondihabitans sp. PAMC 28766]|uniref:aldo/keto reductase n=1 Tax=Frondihabitans sp. PAMC 28766 TaxID=1795630 RepID=UPI00078C0243|nr:aldo/keto reductase [Frondihabitans sp. PAMC 28766]AMM22745.1 aldo/keto reductase [Frondihabitans sp. PAMC 28766]